MKLTRALVEQGGTADSAFGSGLGASEETPRRPRGIVADLLDYLGGYVPEVDFPGSERRQGVGQDGEEVQPSSGCLGQGGGADPSLRGSGGSPTSEDGQHVGQALSLSNQIGTILFFLTVASQADGIALGWGC